jgi:ribosomal protein S6
MKKISHPIKKNREALYYFMKLKLDGTKIAELRYNLKVTDGILRTNIVKSFIEVVK